MMAETMRETMRMVMMQGAGDPRFMGFHPNMSMGMGHPHALTTGNDKFFSSGQPITIHNHVGVEQSTEAEATQNMVSHHVSNLINKCLQKLKSASGGPWGLVMAGEL